MPRAPNAVDFWRGFALIEIFINHIPGNLYEVATHKSLSQSDSAELFVFLAGWSLNHVVGPPDHPRPALHLVARLVFRAFTLYCAHIIIEMLAIGMISGASRVLDNPLILEWFNAAAVFNDPVETHIGLVLLTHQLGYFDILPLYVVLLLISPAMALLHRAFPQALLPVSFAIYLASLVTETTIPTWPTEGEWFFNPFCWQFIFVVGFLMAQPSGSGGWVRAHLHRIQMIAWPIIIVCAALKWFNISVDPTSVPEPHLLFVTAKSFLSPDRFLQFMMLVAAFSSVFPFIQRRISIVSGALSLLGRNSLLVFCFGSLLSLAAQIGRYALKGGFVFDTSVVVGGILLLFAVAVTAEWWERAK